MMKKLQFIIYNFMSSHKSKDENIMIRKLVNNRTSMVTLDIVTVTPYQKINTQLKELAWQLSICKTEYKVSYKPVVEATPMASILDQYEEESARATSISSVTPIQVPVSSNIFHSTHIEGTFTYIVFSIILKHINIQNFHILILDCQLNMTVQLIVIIIFKGNTHFKV